MSLATRTRPTPEEVDVHYAKPWKQGSLLKYLRSDTLLVHLEAYDGIKDLLFDGAGDKSVEDRIKAYKLYLLQLYVVYTTYEEELSKHSSHPAIQTLYFPKELNRASLIEEDLNHFYGDEWRKMMDKDILPATKSYKERLIEVSATKPELLIAHAYDRNLGDISNGLAIKELLIKYCKFTGSEGLRYYSYENIDNLCKFREMYAEKMNETVTTETEIEALVDEGNKGFQYITDMIKAIAAMG